ncbi:mannitol 1-phosphate dehydrogenase [Paramyrothecium foliicola]|nr:mannitol 1-phosphate dehydrogenase [Paramyrothecium foliicola]
MAPPGEFCQSSVKPFDIAIVGGGIAGLTLALHLLIHRVPIKLYEQASQFGEIGAGVSFGPNSTKALNLISPHILKAFEEAETNNLAETKKNVWFDFRYGDTCDGRRADGGLICTLKCGGGQRGVKRSAFLDGLVKLLPNGVAEFGKRVETLTQEDDGVTLFFQDGSTAKHDVVIGCDGIKSRIRRVLLGEGTAASTPTFSGKYAYRGLVPMEQAAAELGAELAGNSQMYLGRHGHILTFPIAKGEIMNVVAFGSAKTWESAQWVKPVAKQDVVDEYSHWGHSVRRIIDIIQEPDLWALFDHPPAQTYHEGLVAIVGDAAHAATPHKGGGAGMAIEDAYVLGNILGAISDKSHIPTALSAYDAVRRARSQRLVADSREQGMLFDFELGTDDPDLLASNILQRMDWLWDYDITKELEEAYILLGRVPTAEDGSGVQRSRQSETEQLLLPPQICGRVKRHEKAVAVPGTDASLISEYIGAYFTMVLVSHCKVSLEAVGLNRIFNFRADEEVHHDPEITKDIGNRERPDRVYGLRETRNIELLLYDIQSLPSQEQAGFNDDSGSEYSMANLLDQPMDAQGDAQLYPFLVLEAKKGASNEWSAIDMQTSFSIRTLLETQARLFSAAKLRFTCVSVPLVWFLSNKGEDWRLCAAYTEQHLLKRDATGTTVYRVIDVWRGCIKTRDGALQLLLLVDYIFDWARDIYRSDIIQALKSVAYGNDETASITDTAINTINRIDTFDEPLQNGQDDEQYHRSQQSFVDLDSPFGAIRHATFVESRYYCLFITADNVETLVKSTAQVQVQSICRAILGEIDSSISVDLETLSRIEEEWTGYSRQVAGSLDPNCPLARDDFRMALRCTTYLSATWHQIRELSVIAIEQNAWDAVVTAAGLKKRKKLEITKPYGMSLVLQSIAKLRAGSPRKILHAAILGTSVGLFQDKRFKPRRCVSLDFEVGLLRDIVHFIYTSAKRGRLFISYKLIFRELDYWRNVSKERKDRGIVCCPNCAGEVHHEKCRECIGFVMDRSQYQKKQDSAAENSIAVLQRLSGEELREKIDYATKLFPFSNEGSYVPRDEYQNYDAHADWVGHLGKYPHLDRPFLDIGELCGQFDRFLSFWQKYNPVHGTYHHSGFDLDKHSQSKKRKRGEASEANNEKGKGTSTP